MNIYVAANNYYVDILCRHTRAEIARVVDVYDSAKKVFSLNIETSNRKFTEQQTRKILANQSQPFKTCNFHWQTTVYYVKCSR